MGRGRRRRRGRDGDARRADRARRAPAPHLRARRAASSTPSGSSASPASATRWRRAPLVIAKRLKAVTDMPVLVGVGVSNAEQAVEACAVADGVVIGSAIVRRLLDGEGPEGVGRFRRPAVRRALDAADHRSRRCVHS